MVRFVRPNMKLKTGVSVLLALGGIIAQGASPSTSLPSSRPDILLVIADDLDNLTFSTALSNGLMPNLQQASSKGVNFSRAYVTDPRGCPTRESWLTGKYFTNLQADTRQCGVSLFNDSSTLPVWLKVAGYRTSLIGKYFDGSCYTDCNHDGQVTWADTTYIPPGWDNFQSLQYDQPWYTPTGPPAGVVTLGQDNPNQYEYFINNNGVLEYHGDDPADYQTDVLRGYTKTFMGTSIHKPMPIFLYLAFGAPHIETAADPNQYDQYSDGWTWLVRDSPSYAGSADSILPPFPLSFSERDVTDKPQWVRAKPLLTSLDQSNVTRQFQSRLAALRSIDDSIGDLIRAEEGAGRPYVLIFTSDNGWQYGSHRLTGKLDAYEESIGVPLVVTGSIPLSMGQDSPAFITPNDLAPTVMDLAGGSMPYPGDGKSFVPLLTFPNQPWRNRFLVAHRNAMGAKATFDMPDYLASRTAPGSIGTGDQLYVQWSTGEKEFYDLPTDPSEMISRHTATDPRRQAQMNLHVTNINQLSACGNGTCQILEFQP